MTFQSKEIDMDNRQRTQEVDMIPVPFATKFILRSEILGEDRTILVRVPESYNRWTQRYPVLYMLDGELPLFTSHAGVITQLSEWESRIPEMILVGIPNTDRPRDMLPKGIELPNGRIHGGGADAFLAFLTDELVPTIDSEFRTQPYRLLSGTSASGLAVAHALVTGMPGFSAFFASSPTVGTCERELFGRAEMAGLGDETRKFLAIFSGDDDMEGVQKDCEDFAELLSKVEANALDVRHWVHEDEGHCPFDGFRRSLLALYEHWTPSDEIIESGLDGVQAHYEALSEQVGYTIELPVSAYESIAERMIDSDRADTAIELLQVGLERYSHAARIVFYLVIALARSERRDEARKLLEDALTVDRPGNNRLQQLMKHFSD
jgi:uncharacterized protein